MGFISWFLEAIMLVGFDIFGTMLIEGEKIALHDSTIAFFMAI
jgi:hypothetical protein